MKKIYLLLISTLILFTSCSENGDSYIGTYTTENHSISIKKAGSNFFFIKYDDSSNNYNSTSKFEEGCFLSISDLNTDIVPYPYLCVEDKNTIISRSGRTYKRKE